MSKLILDIADFARQQQQRTGELTLESLPRIANEVVSATPIHYALAGGRDSIGRGTVDMRLEGELALRCQRCLQPMPFELDVAIRFTLFGNEEKLEAAEEEDEELEGLLIDEAFDLLNLIEDEILLTLPYAPTHDACETSVKVSAAAPQATQKPNPFAVLAELKGKLKSSDE